MQGTWNCPICGDLMRGIRQTNRLVYSINKLSTYSERTCNGINHCLQILVDEKTKEVDLIKISLNANYDRFIYLDMLNQKCKISCFKNNKEVSFIDVPKMIQPDFPLLTELKDRVSMYLIFS